MSKPEEENKKRGKTWNFQYPVDQEDELSIRPSSLVWIIQDSGEEQEL